MERMSELVAIVDDDSAVRRALHRLVSSLDYRPVSFESGEAFLSSLADVLPGCVLMDQHMPTLNGLDVVGRMRAEGRDVPVIIVTGFDQPGLREKCADANVAGYLLKPLDASQISAAIESATRT